MDKRTVFSGGIGLSVGIALFLFGWSLGSSGHAFWFVLLGLAVSTIGFFISVFGATSDLVKHEWVQQETPRRQKLILKTLAYLGLALGLLTVLLVTVSTALLLMGYI